MSQIRKDIAVLSFAVPLKAKELLEGRVELEGFPHRSDLLRKIIMDYLRYHTAAEDFAEILAEIEKMEANRI
ncbi:MAG: hypothetical protein U9O96_08335 [Candidatus Thermoplasmatota archaeon]|nr:hypothetical protein [Candidatus Thermoplasmatota archaeon]